MRSSCGRVYATTDPMQCAVRDALIAFMAATAQAQAEATKSAQRAGIDHKRNMAPSAYLGRKPSLDTIREFMRRGIVIKTVINGMTFDGTTSV
jgi:hypothetical protein